MPRKGVGRGRSGLSRVASLIIVSLVMVIMGWAGTVSASHQVWVDNPKKTTVDANWHEHDPHPDLKVDGWLTWYYWWCWDVVGQPQDCSSSVKVYAIYIPEDQPGGGCIWNQPMYYEYTIGGLTPDTYYEFRMMIVLAKFHYESSCTPPTLNYPLEQQNLGTNYCIEPSLCRARTLPGNPDPPPRGGSPRVALYGGTGNWTKETNVLPQSESYEGGSPPDWDDAMQFTGVAHDTTGTYRVTVHEYDNALNSFDQIKLTAVDYPSGYSVAVAPDGSIHSYSATSVPVYATGAFGQNALPLVAEPDGMFYEEPLSGPLTVGFGSLSGEKQKILFGSRDYVVDREGGPQKCGIPVQVRSMSGSWGNVTTLYPRVDNRIQILDLTGLFAATGSIDVRFLLRPEHQVDWVALDRNHDAPMTITDLPPLQLNISDGSFANLQALMSDDGMYLPLPPGYFIHLVFPVPPQLRDQRALVLRVNGYYTVEGGGDGLGSSGSGWDGPGFGDPNRWGP